MIEITTHYVMGRVTVMTPRKFLNHRVGDLVCLIPSLESGFIAAVGVITKSVSYQERIDAYDAVPSYFCVYGSEGFHTEFEPLDNLHIKVLAR